MGAVGAFATVHKQLLDGSFKAADMQNLLNSVKFIESLHAETVNNAANHAQADLIPELKAYKAAPASPAVPVFVPPWVFHRFLLLPGIQLRIWSRSRARLAAGSAPPTHPLACLVVLVCTITISRCGAVVLWSRVCLSSIFSILSSFSSLSAGSPAPQPK